VGEDHNQKIRYVAEPHQGRGNDASASVTFLPSGRFLESKRGFFFKASSLWRL